MSTLAVAARPVVRVRWAPPLIALTVGLLALLVLFRPEAAAAVHVWRNSTAYGHCWLVLPIALWLAWDRRHAWADAAARPIAWPALLALPLAGAWVGAALLGLMEGRQLAAIACVELLFLAVLGWRLWWAVSAALLYLFFLVPFGGFLVAPLQAFTAAFIAGGLDLLGIPNVVTALRIEIPDGVFYVAEACAGLRFLIASVAFGVLYAVTMFRSPGRRAAFIAVACVVPVIANGMRGLGIVVLGHLLGSAEAATADHLIYGWVFFSVVIVLLALAGMPFRQAPSPARAFAQSSIPPDPLRTAMAAAAILLAAGSGPVLGAWLDARAIPAGRPATALLTTPPGCAAAAAEIAGAVATQRFTCGDARLVATTTRLPRRANPSRIVDAGQGAAFQRLGGDLDGSSLEVPNGAPHRWGLATEHGTGRGAAYAIWVDGIQAGGGLRDRLQMARDLLAGSDVTPVAIVVAVASGRGDPADALARFLGSQGDLSSRVAGLASQK